VFCRLRQSSALQSATSPFATALPFSAALPLSPGPRPASPQADTPRFATLGKSNAKRSMLGGSSHHAERSSYALEGSVNPVGRSFQAHVSGRESAYQERPPVGASQYHVNTPGRSSHLHTEQLASSHTHTGLRESSQPHASLGGSDFPCAPEEGTVMHGALSGSPHRGALASGSPYRSPAHAAAVSAVEQQPHTSLHEGSGLFGTSRAVPNSPSPMRQSMYRHDVSPSRYGSSDAYQRWSSQTSQAEAHHYSDTRLSSRPHAVHALLPRPPAESDLLLRPVSQHMHPSPELDSLTQRLREQKLAMGKQRQGGVSPLRGQAGYTPTKGLAAYSGISSRPGQQQGYRQAGRPHPSPSR